MHEIRLRLVDHEILDGRVVAVRCQEPAKVDTLLLRQGFPPKPPGVRRVLGCGEVLAVGQLMVQDHAPHCAVHQGTGPRARDGDDRADSGGAGPAFLAHEGAQTTFLSGQRDLVALGKREEASKVRGAVIMPVIECVRSCAAGPDRGRQLRVVQHPVMRQARLLDECRNTVEHASLLSQRGEVKHQHAGILCKAEDGEGDRRVVQDCSLIGRADCLSARHQPPRCSREAHKQHSQQGGVQRDDTLATSAVDGHGLGRPERR